MLIDLLREPNEDWDGLGPGLLVYQQRLAKAESFVIARDLAEVIDNMSREDVGAAMPFCRLPFPVCWIEVVHRDRPKFARVEVAPGHFMPVRTGILCEQAEPDDQTKFYATLAWSFSDADAKRQGLRSAPINICPLGCYIDTQKPGFWPGAAYGKPDISAPFWLDIVPAPYWGDLIDATPLAGLKRIRANADNDWAGEVWFWLAALSLLNARNAIQTTPRPVAPALNRSRAKAGKLPLRDFHELTLRMTPREARAQREAGAHGGGMRAHIVRGHFKVRATGIYWWRPFVRGEVAEGFAKKTYNVAL